MTGLFDLLRAVFTVLDVLSVPLLYSDSEGLLPRTFVSKNENKGRGNRYVERGSLASDACEGDGLTR